MRQTKGKEAVQNGKFHHLMTKWPQECNDPKCITSNSVKCLSVDVSFILLCIFYICFVDWEKAQG